MKQQGTKPLWYWLVIIVSMMVCASPVRAAESTADVSADAALKEKERISIMGEAGARSMDAEYRIGYRDILHVSIYGEGSMDVGEGMVIQSDLAGENDRGGSFLRGRGRGVEVRNDGRISLRHIGDVSVVGMTPTQLADYLKRLYSTIYGDPILTVTLVQSNSQQYTVMGQVMNPGLYHLDFPLTVVKAIARAGGFTEWAKNSVTIIRSPESAVKGMKPEEIKGETFTFDYSDFLKGKNLAKNIYIASGDVIVVH